MSNQTSDNNKRIAKDTMIYDKIINKLKGIQRMFAYNIKNILLNGIASSVFTPPSPFSDGLGGKMALLYCKY